MAIFREIDTNTKINGSLLVGLASIFSNDLNVNGILAAGDISDINAAIKSKFNSSGGSVSGNVVINGSLNVTGGISGIDLTQYYTKINLQTSGQGSVHWANLTNIPAATTAVAGIVRLNNTTSSTSTTQAATANAVRTAYNLANGKWTYDEATIEAVKVSNAVNADTVNEMEARIEGTPSTITARDEQGNITAADTFKYGSTAYTKYNPVTKSIDFVFN